MAEEKSWTLLDVNERIRTEEIELGMGEAWSIRKATLRGGMSDGVDLVEVDNGVLSFSILPTRGMGIWRGRYKDLDLGWKSPVQGPVHPKFVNLPDREGLGWLAGFDELIVRCGLDNSGAPDVDVVPGNTGTPVEVKLPLHGRIANIPAHKVEVRVIDGDPPGLVVEGVTEETGLFLPHFRMNSRVSTKVGSNRFCIEDEIINRRAVEQELELMYHCNFGPPFLGEGSRIHIPAREVAPYNARAQEGIETYHTYRAPLAGFVEQCYFFVPLGDARGDTLALLRNKEEDIGVALRFNTDRLPAFTLWKNTAAEEDGYVTGLEPGTDYSNSKVFERKQGRVVKVPPRESYKASVTLEVLDTPEGVKGVQAEIAAIQDRAPLIVHKEPQPHLSPWD